MLHVDAAGLSGPKFISASMRFTIWQVIDMRYRLLALPLALCAIWPGCATDDFDPGLDGGSFENP